jgi:DhnA family fructose-bisphosphate aldolase class Ia
LGDYGKRIRLNRILRTGRGTMVVAFDHPIVHGPIAGTIDPARQIQRFADAQADAILLNFGAFRHFAELRASQFVPGLIARLDWTTALGGALKTSGNEVKSCLVANPEDALRSGADAVITFLVIGTHDAEFEKNEIQRVGRVARECERLGMPLVVESLARGPKVENPCDPKWLMLHSRIAAELGADMIKTEYSGDTASMRAVVNSCPVPILVLGGSRTGSDQDVLDFVSSIVKSGAAGVFFGRNVFQADNMPVLLQRVRAVLGGQEPAQGS